MKAFPTTNGQTMAPLGTGYDEGMDLRDYFAAKAMQSLITASSTSYIHENELVVKRPIDNEISMYAYKMADAMMEVRGKK